MKKKLTLVVTCVVLVAAMVIGGTLAYFTDTKEATNTFTMGNVKITLDETNVNDPDGDRVTENDYGSMYPGRTVTKDPIVHNTGASAAYVRAKVTISGPYKFMHQVLPYLNPGCVDAEGKIDYNAAFKALVGGLGAKWTLLEDQTALGLDENGTWSATYIIKYDEPLAASADTAAIFEKVTIPADFDTDVESADSFAFNINVVAEAIQVEGMTDWTDAFAKFDGKA